jgi:tetratricopeptide (TPR) repeat protein
MDRLNQLLKQYASKPSDTFIMYAIAKEYEKSGNYPETMHFFEKIIIIDPNYLAVYYHFAKILMEINDFDKAKSILYRGIEIAKNLKDIKTMAELKNLLYNITLDELDY